MKSDALALEDALPKSLPEFQQLFPDEIACATYLERSRWAKGFLCPYCSIIAEPVRLATRPGILKCRKCRRQTGLLSGTVMERSHTPLNIWFWAAYLVATQTPGMSAVQLQRRLALSRYQTAFGILHKLRAGMVRLDQHRIGGIPISQHVEVDDTYVGGRTRGEGRGVHHKVLVACAVEVWHLKPGTAQDKRKDGYAAHVRLAVIPDRSSDSLCGFVERSVAPRTLIVTDDWSGYAGLSKLGYTHRAVAERRDSRVAEALLPMTHLVFADVKSWLLGIHHGVSAKHLQAYLNEYTFRFNRGFYPFHAFQSLLGIAG